MWFHSSLLKPEGPPDLASPWFQSVPSRAWATLTAPARPIFSLAPKNQKALTMSEAPACQLTLAL